MLFVLLQKDYSISTNITPIESILVATLSIVEWYYGNSFKMGECLILQSLSSTTWTTAMVVRQAGVGISEYLGIIYRTPKICMGIVWESPNTWELSTESNLI